MINTNIFEIDIRNAARKDDDIRLAETIYAYFLAIAKIDFIPWKKIKSFFVAAREKESDIWKELGSEEAKAVDNVLVWTGHSANTIAVILRTYERSAEKIKNAQREGRISRYTAENISRLYRGTLQELQPRLLEMYFKYEMTHEDLKKLVQELERTVSQAEQDSVLEKYMPAQPQIQMGPLFTEAQVDDDVSDVESIFIFSEMKLSELAQLPDDELWKLKGTTEKAIQQAVPLLEKSLKLIQKELINRLSKN